MCNHKKLLKALLLLMISSHLINGSMRSASMMLKTEPSSSIFFSRATLTIKH